MQHKFSLFLSMLAFLWLTNAQAQSITVTAFPDIVRDRPCEVMAKTMGWNDGDDISLAVLQDKIKNMPPSVALTPISAANQLLSLKDVEHVTFDCTNSTVENHVATLVFSYQLGGVTYTLPEITLTIQRSSTTNSL